MTRYHIFVNGTPKITYFDLATAIQSFNLICEVAKKKKTIDLIDGQTGEVLDSTMDMVYMGKEV